jgi:ABC-type lipoprotein release transport system permease subunit
MRGVTGLAVRSLTRQWKRYRLLGSALAFSFFIIVLIASVLSAMVSSLTEKAKIYYGGDFSIRGIENGGGYFIRDPVALRAATRAILGPKPFISERYEHKDTSTTLYFGGEGIRQRLVIGIDFSIEADLFRRFNYIQGNAEGIKGTNGILISEPIARILKARVGDDILLLIPTLAGQKNTANVVVRGIFRDSSLFGYYTSYFDIDFLRGLVGMPPSQCSTLAVFYPGNPPANDVIPKLQRALEKNLPMYPLFDSRQALFNHIAAVPMQGMSYAILSLQANLEQVQQLLDAVYIIAIVLIALLLGVVILGVSGSYKVIVHERSKEIGTMRAIGMQRGAATRLFITEATLLALLGCLVGAVLAWAALALLGLVNFSFIPFFDIFLRGGRIQASLSILITLPLATILLATALLAVAGPARHAAKVEPLEAMRKGE